MNTEEFRQMLATDADGMATYEYIVNHCECCMENMPEMLDNLKRVDSNGQFLCSTARYLGAIDREGFAEWINKLVEAAIEKDRERRYIGALLEALWGEDYQQHADEISEVDDNFRRIYKRLYGVTNSL